MNNRNTIRILYLDDCDIDHRLLQAYLRLDDTHSYDVTACSTLEEAKAALERSGYDALILDNRVPPFNNYHQTYREIKEACGFSGPTLVVSADTKGDEFGPAARQDHEVVIDKADLMEVIRTGSFVSWAKEGQTQGLQSRAS
ncbi:MAG: hypothetical protein AB8B88_12455 [Devosiaceae bacterium]